MSSDRCTGLQGREERLALVGEVERRALNQPRPQAYADTTHSSTPSIRSFSTSSATPSALHGTPLNPRLLWSLMEIFQFDPTPALFTNTSIYASALSPMSLKAKTAHLVGMSLDGLDDCHTALFGLLVSLDPTSQPEPIPSSPRRGNTHATTFFPISFTAESSTSFLRPTMNTLAPFVAKPVAIAGSQHPPACSVDAGTHLCPVPIHRR